MNRSARGFTLIEALVVVAIIGLLIGLLLPAVMHFREASRRATCGDHLRQLGLALQQHHSAKGQYPSALAGRFTDARGRTFVVEPSGYYSLLPFLDQASLYQFYVPSKGTTQTLVWGVENHTLRTTVIGVLLCPSEGRATPADSAPVSYRFNMTVYGRKLEPGVIAPGLDTYANGSLRAGAAFELARSLTSRDFRDGQSNTVGMSERLLGSQGDHFDPRRDFWYSGVRGLFQPQTPEELAKLCASLSGYPAAFGTKFGLFWVGGTQQDTWYHHVLPPNSRVSDCSTHEDPESALFGSIVDDAAVAARSEHAGGVQSVYMDGSVRFATDGVSRVVWWALATRAGGEAFGGALE